MSTKLNRALAIGALVLMSPTAALAQDTTRRTIGLDPYKPSDAKILREQGPAVATKMTIEEIKKLDPYNPTDASLLRQMGGAIPVCCLDLLGASFPAGGVYVPHVSLAQIAPRQAPQTAAQVTWVCRGEACAVTRR
jgi:hypothetical protein